MSTSILRSHRIPLGNRPDFRPRAVSRSATVAVRAGILEPGATVLVAGATGGIGQLVTAKLLDRGFKVKALTRSGRPGPLQDYGPNLTVVGADLREPGAAEPLLEGVDAVVAATGTTAYPTKRWEGNNGPRPTDWVASSNLINAAAKRKLARYVLVTSAGVERYESFPFNILNLFGVLKYKRDSELLLASSGLPFTVLRPGALIDGPFTSYGFKTLLQVTAGSRQDVELALSDRLTAEASRVSVAEAVVQALLTSSAEGKFFALSSKEGEGPGSDPAKWDALFSTASA